AHAQQPTQVSTVLIGRAFNDVVSNDAAPVAAAAEQDTAPAPTDQGTLASSADQTSAPAAKAEVHPPPPHTGFRALASDTWADFKAFPRRRSTWVILAIGAGGALLALVIATYVATSRLHDNVHFLSDVIMGSAIGTATGWTVVGRHGRSSYALNPVAVPGGFAFQISHVDRGE